MMIPLKLLRTGNTYVQTMPYIDSSRKDRHLQLVQMLRRGCSAVIGFNPR